MDFNQIGTGTRKKKKGKKKKSKEEVRLCTHYENLPMQYTEIFIAIKNENFQQKNFDIFVIFAQNIDCGAVLTSTHSLCFGAKIKKIGKILGVSLYGKCSHFFFFSFVFQF